MPVVDLCCLETPYLGLLIPAPTGVFWTNQVGGTACMHPEIEGFYIPLPSGRLPDDDPLYGGAGTYDAQDVRAFLNRDDDLRLLFEAPEEWEVKQAIVLRPSSGRAFMAEAWVPVKVATLNQVIYAAGTLESVQGRIGILVYPNSD